MTPTDDLLSHTYEITKVDEQLARYLLFSEELGHVRSGPGTHGVYTNFEDVSPPERSTA